MFQKKDKNAISALPGLWWQRILIAILFIGISSLIMVVFSPWQPMLDRGEDYLGRIGIVLLLITIFWLLPNSASLLHIRKIVLALLTMAVAVSLDWIFGLYLIESVHLDDNTPLGFALLKLNECILIVSVIIIFTKLTGEDLKSLYIQKGNIKLGLIIGLGTFVVAALTAIPSAKALFGGEGLNLSTISPWVPWLLIFIFANAAMEEILFRGLFLRKLEPVYGKFFSNFLIAFVFTGLHLFATYSSDQYLFIAILFPLALLWGYITQKTEAVWASILFHAGMDIHIMLGIFSGLS